MIYLGSFLLTLLATSSLIFLAIFLYFQYSFTHWKRKGVPHLIPTFPFGNIKTIAKEQQSIGSFMETVHNELKKQTKDFGGFYMFHKPVFVPLSPDVIKNIMLKDFAHFEDRGLYCNEENDPLSAHMVALSGERWRKMRGKISPNYTSGKMKLIFPILLGCSKDLEGIIEEHAEKDEAIDIQDLMKRFTSDNISECAFGLRCNSLNNPDEEFNKCGKLFIETSFGEGFKMILSFICPWFLDLFKMKFTNDEVEKFFLNAVKQTVDYRKENDVRRKDFLDLFIKLMEKEYVTDDGDVVQNPETFSLNQVAAQAFVIYIAGYETSSTGLAFCFYELGINQDIQEKLREEVGRVLKKHNGEITYEGLLEMTYMDKVIYETLRKYPPIPEVIRICCKDYKIPGTEIVIEKGTRCWFSLFGLQMDPEYYPNPEKFDPERFSEEEKSKRHPFVYLPFGEGPRVCLGIKFGMIQMKIALVKILRGHEVILDERTPVPVPFSNRGLLLATKVPIRIRVSGSKQTRNCRI